MLLSLKIPRKLVSDDPVIWRNTVVFDGLLPTTKWLALLFLVISLVASCGLPIITFGRLVAEKADILRRLIGLSEEYFFSVS